MVSQTSRTGSDDIFHDKRFHSMPKECESRFIYAAVLFKAQNDQKAALISDLDG